ncbi:MAG: hypothetical protein NUW37_09435 [Planctomycetes bacterium]|nr:hypothetical protein [Planctomycetota bacterium]
MTSAKKVNKDIESGKPRRKLVHMDDKRKKKKTSNSVSDLGWTSEQILEARMRLGSFEEDWNAPGMEIYDEL